uniref:Uncharacterized protein n=1 Tax=Brassica oleracea var. oleracea TaxID=109376 RepID=A0A0D3E2D4_BRAOL
MEVRRCNIIDQGEEPSIDCGKRRTIGLKRNMKRRTTESGKKPPSTTDGKVEAEPRADDYTKVSDVWSESKANGFPIERTAVGDISLPKVI